MRALHPTVALMAGVTMGAITLGVVGIALGFSTNEPAGDDPHGGLSIPQAASSERDGISIQVTEAVFSATESILVLSISVDPGGGYAWITTEDMYEFGVRSDSVISIGTAGNNAAVVYSERETLVVEIPPVVEPGGFAVTIESLDVRTSERSVTVNGPWELLLVGPTPERYDRAMETWTVHAADQGRDIDIVGTASVSKLSLTYPIDTDAVELAAPRIVFEGDEEALPSSWQRSDATTAVAEFRLARPPTEIEAVKLGQRAYLSDSREWVEIDVRDAALAAGHSAGDEGPFPVDAKHSSSDEGIVAGAELGADPGGRQWLAITLVGNWLLPVDDAEHRRPAIYSADGRELRLRNIEVEFAKDANLHVREGHTRVFVYYDDLAELGPARLELRAVASVDDAAPDPVALSLAME